MATMIEKVGRRVYLIGLPFAAKDRAKRELGMDGSNWDGERRQWFVGLAKRAAAEALVGSLNAGAFEATPASARAAETVGLRADTPAAWGVWKRY